MVALYAVMETSEERINNVNRCAQDCVYIRGSNS